MNEGSVKTAEIFNRRTAGCLLHPTSLPASALGHCLPPSGNLGPGAHNFVHFLQSAGLGVWQMLPTGPTHEDRSPYQSWSTHAGSPNLICLHTLMNWGWLDNEALQHHLPAAGELSFDAMANLREVACEAFFHYINTPAGAQVKHNYQCFVQEQAHWLEDFALFLALRKAHNGKSWLDWPKPLRLREADALAEAREAYPEDIAQAYFEQFAFNCQWQALRDTAREAGVRLFGDIPIFVALDSVDVWAHPDQFMLDESGQPLTVAGVPPDYFSDTGQHWGNPHYRWAAMEQDDFHWWRERLAGQLQQFDLIRIDHFRGLDAYWEIPANSPDASRGQWVDAPGEKLLESFFRHFHTLPIVAENLGLITDSVENLRKQFSLPGMLVLQFGLDGEPANTNSPHHFEPVNIVYTGTHDNDTTEGWLENLSPDEKSRIAEYLNTTELSTWSLIKTALGSVARMAIVPLQDWLSLDNTARMNTPGTDTGNWHWRFQWQDIPDDLPVRIRRETHIYDRLGRDLPFAGDQQED